MPVVVEIFFIERNVHSSKAIKFSKLICGTIIPFQNESDL
jgi:hypothetical protein